MTVTLELDEIYLILDKIDDILARDIVNNDDWMYFKSLTNNIKNYIVHVDKLINQSITMQLKTYSELINFEETYGE